MRGAMSENKNYSFYSVLQSCRIMLYRIMELKVNVL